MWSKWIENTGVSPETGKVKVKLRNGRKFSTHSDSCCFGIVNECEGEISKYKVELSTETWNIHNLGVRPKELKESWIIDVELRGNTVVRGKVSDFNFGDLGYSSDVLKYRFVSKKEKD